MSWNEYITRLQTVDKSGTVPVAEAVICGTDGSVWASTPGLASITPEEVKKLCGDGAAMRECGPKVAGKKCMMLRDNRDDVMQYCIQLKASKNDGGNPICVGVSNKALVIAMGGDGVGGGQLTPKVYDIVKHLRDSGY